MCVCVCARACKCVRLSVYVCKGYVGKLRHCETTFCWEDILYRFLTLTAFFRLLHLFQVPHTWPRCICIIFLSLFPSYNASVLNINESNMKSEFGDLHNLTDNAYIVYVGFFNFEPPPYILQFWTFGQIIVEIEFWVLWKSMNWHAYVFHLIFVSLSLMWSHNFEFRVEPVSKWIQWFRKSVRWYLDCVVCTNERPKNFF